jgi:hypothetical protein
VYDAGGTLVRHVPACDPFPPGFPIPVDHTKFPSLPVADFYAAGDLAGTVQFSWQFGSPIDVLTNADVFYTVVPFTKLRGNVLLIRAKKPTSSPAVASPRIDPSVQARLFTVCSYNFWNGAGNDCVSEEDIAVDAGGFYNIVVSEPSDRPSNATAENGVTWVDWGPFLDGRIAFRNLMVDDALWVDVAEAVKTGIAPEGLDPGYVPIAAHCHTGVFEEGGVQACLEWNEALYGK